MEGCCSHDHDCEDENCGGTSLHGYIDTTKVTVLNASNPDCLKNIFRPWDQRLARDVEPLHSDEDDPELLLFIPFTSDVKIRTIMIIGGPDGSSPSRMRVFTNREGLDFQSVADLPAVQEWDLLENLNGEVEYQTRFTKFQGVANLTIHLPTSFGGDRSTIWFVGLRGEGTKNVRQPVTNVVYESVP
eukprot:CAMPEP_0198214572 /NCGR_PEP_ID=MMETSP1445-20131203/42488_1 /TAXON_ID=36898 /ORGANISM="Pyramimonas sp., Strain CCMP2087" /LENGTH=186 /DNA_ID=CAMNT_0043889835 /DNA_START=76 /DNA_END=633 /DNA_ORIENTATION=+